MQKRLSKIFPLLLILIALLPFSGCDGGGISCPFYTPSCCFDSLFGCGTFDLPSGCSCSQYGYMSRSADDKQKSMFVRKLSRAQSWSKGYQGVWTGIMTKMSASPSCSLLLNKMNGYVSIKERKTTVSVSIPGFGTYEGRKRTGGFTASGSARPLLSNCRANVSVNFTSVSDGVGNVRGDISYVCGKTPLVCKARYTGTIQRND